MNSVIGDLSQSVMQASQHSLNWAHALGAPSVSGQIKTSPEDFQVTEQLPFEPSGDGEHVYLRVRKTGLNTEDLAKILAQHAGVVRSAIGYAGMKDRQARTEQWFSVPVPPVKTPDWTSLNNDQVEILAVTRHARKLKRGVLKGNGFCLILRDLRGDLNMLDARITVLSQQGVPNYFGPQRFGHQGRNLDRALAYFQGSLRLRGRHQKGLMLSTARAWLFNQVLNQRVLDGTWRQALPGDVMCLSGSHQYFVPDQIDQDICQRISEGDISPSGPLPGIGDVPVNDDVKALEADVNLRYSDYYDGLINARVEHARRPLIVWPESFKAEWLDQSTLKLQFALPAGSYATSVVRELVQIETLGEAAWI